MLNTTDSITPLDLRSWLRLLIWCLAAPSRLAAYRAGLDAAGQVRLRQTAAWTANTLIYVPLMLLILFVVMQPPLLSRLGQATLYSWNGGFARAVAANPPAMLLLTEAALVLLAGLGIYVTSRPGDRKGISLAPMYMLYFLTVAGLTFVLASVLAAPLLNGGAVIWLLGLIFGVFNGLALILSEELRPPGYLLPLGVMMGLVMGATIGVSSLVTFPDPYPDTLSYVIAFFIPVALANIPFYRRRHVLRAYKPIPPLQS
jgi:hypothetical protein